MMDVPSGRPRTTMMGWAQFIALLLLVAGVMILAMKVDTLRPAARYTFMAGYLAFAALATRRTMADRGRSVLWRIGELLGGALAFVTIFFKDSKLDLYILIALGVLWVLRTVVASFYDGYREGPLI